MLNSAVAASFENMEESKEVRIGIGVGIGERVSDAGLGSQVHHDIEPMAGKKILHCRSICKVDRSKGECTRVELLESRLFEVGIVIIVQIVDTDHFPSLAE